MKFKKLKLKKKKKDNTSLSSSTKKTSKKAPPKKEKNKKLVDLESLDSEERRKVFAWAKKHGIELAEGDNIESVKVIIAEKAREGYLKNAIKVDEKLTNTECFGKIPDEEDESCKICADLKDCLEDAGRLTVEDALPIESELIPVGKEEIKLSGKEAEKFAKGLEKYEKSKKKKKSKEKEVKKTGLKKLKFKGKKIKLKRK